MPTRRRLVQSCVLTLMCAATATAQSWPAAGLALRTNGSSFREGSCVRVTLLALEDVPGPLAAQVSYAFDQAIALKPSGVQDSLLGRQHVADRPPGASLDFLDAGTSIILDDTFCFGVGSPIGPIQINVALASSGTSAGSLSTCVEFQSDSAGTSAPPVTRCEFGLRGLSRRDDTNTLTLEGQFPFGGLFRLAFLRGDRLLQLLEGGLVVAVPGELNFVVPALGPDGDGQVDLVLQDQLAGRSATLGNVSLLR